MAIHESHPAHFRRPPSRHDNPFATCWTKPGALAYRFPNGGSAEQLVAQLAAQNWRGEIVGPHGSGKTTLLATLLPALTAAGRHVTAIALHDRRRWLLGGFLRRALCVPQPLVIVDGYEQLSRAARIWLRGRCRQARAGLLITSHGTTSLPPLCRLEPDLSSILGVVAVLTRNGNSSVTSADVVASHACHGSNVRELLFDLYNRHELAERIARTGSAAVS
jgi:hypothetical protein